MGVNSCGTTLIDNGTFKNIGAITWDTTAKTGNFTAVGGNGYFVNTTSASITVTLPASPSAGDVVGIADYANTADTNKIIIARNGSKIQGQTDDFDIVKEGLSIILIYVDATQGWISIDAGQANDINNKQFITATGGTITTCGNFKIHTFTGPGTFTVTCAGNPSGSDTVDYLVVAGGGSGGSNYGGGGGAGGYRESSGAASGCYTASPLGACVSALPVSVTGYPITVGGGGTGPGDGTTIGNPGSNSIFSTITSTGGGGGATGNNPTAPGAPNGRPGGSGGGGSVAVAPFPIGTAGSGNTPPVSPPQGNNGGLGSTDTTSYINGGGGGGATVVGSTSPNPTPAPQPGGDGATTSISGSSTSYAGGGSGGGASTGGCGGLGGGGDGGTSACAATPATINTGGGGGGGGSSPPTLSGGDGGSGIVIIRYKYQ